MDDSSRREFLRLLGVSSGAALLGFGCSDPADGNGADVGSDDTGANNGQDGGGDADAGPMDANGGDADAAGNGAGSCEATGSDIEGPFYEDGAPHRSVLADEDEPGQRLIVEGTVYEPDCDTPVEAALLDVWHADEQGDYHGSEDDDYRLRGQLYTDADGEYRLETIMPGHYPTPAGDMRPAHIHLTITKPGFEPLTTQMYFEGDPYLSPDDPCGHCSSDDPTLIVEAEEHDGAADLIARFDIVLTEI